MVSQEKSPETLVPMTNLAPLLTHPKMPDRKGFEEGQEGLGYSGWRNCAPRSQSHRHRGKREGWTEERAAGAPVSGQSFREQERHVSKSRVGSRITPGPWVSAAQNCPALPYVVSHWLPLLELVAQ